MPIAGHAIEAGPATSEAKNDRRAAEHACRDHSRERSNACSNRPKTHHGVRPARLQHRFRKYSCEFPRDLAQAAEVARRLGVIDPPTTKAELDEAMIRFRPELRGSRDAREAVRYLLFKPPLPLAARAPYGVLVAAAIGLMPVWTRPQLRLPWLPVAEQTVVRVLGSTAVGAIRWAMTPPARA